MNCEDAILLSRGECEIPKIHRNIKRKIYINLSINNKSRELKISSEIIKRNFGLN